jgi:L-ascorbate metabolism protein UlaG (beta-lactamase superfamily)
MEIKRLNWAGILMESDSSVIMIDPICNVDKALFGEPKETFLPLSNDRAINAVLLTHLHSDHFDSESILKEFGADIPLFVPAAVVPQVKEKGFGHVTGMAPGETAEIGPFKIWAAEAVDGLGDPQVSWIVKDKKHTIFHGGDTLWHGYWWAIAKHYGPFDAVFLSINEAVVQNDGMMPSCLPITMSPEQAAAAAEILTARLLVPIHYHAFMNPPRYVEGARLLERLGKEAQVRGQRVQVAGHGEKISLYAGVY